MKKKSTQCQYTGRVHGKCNNFFLVYEPAEPEQMFDTYFTVIVFMVTAVIFKWEAKYGVCQLVAVNIFCYEQNID